MVKNRNRLDIVASVLEAANSGSNKTRIMFAAKLSFTLLEKYLGIAIDAGFVRVDGSIYFVTDRGQEFLQRYSKFQERYNSAQDLLEALSSEREHLSRLCEKRGLDPINSNCSLES